MPSIQNPQSIPWCLPVHTPMTQNLLANSSAVVWADKFCLKEKKKVKRTIQRLDFVVRMNWQQQAKCIEY